MNRSDLVIDVEAIISEAEPPITDDCCIYKVPNEIREVNAQAYTPKLISIGPLHHYDQRLQNMEKHKQFYFKQFVARTKIELEYLINIVKEFEPRLRRSYSENLEMSPNELVKVILVDACFIIELFCRKHCKEETDGRHNLLKSKLFSILYEDLVLLENQVPFFILEEIYNLAFASDKDRKSHSFLELSICYFEEFTEEVLKPDFMIYHFTDLIRTFRLQKLKPEKKSLKSEQIPTASALNEVGLKFENSESECRLHLEFSKGCLKFPRINVFDFTETFFRNMLALEHCHYPCDDYITDYCHVLSSLINSRKDVDVLIEKGLLLNGLGDNHTVAKLINSLTTNIVVSYSDYQYANLFEELDEFYNEPCRQKWATLKRDYCNTPWRTLATCAAIAILFLTLMQTVFSILQAV